MIGRGEVKLYFVVILVFVMVFAGATESSSNTNFVIGGCTFVFEGSNVSIASGVCSSQGAGAGHFYCGEDATPWVTTDEGEGCSMGNSAYSFGDDFCCPAGMFCNKTSSGLFKCEDRLDSCASQKNKGDCNNNGCVWMDVTKECSNNPRQDYGCGYYDTDAACTTDQWKLGVSGVGTESCGTTIKCNGESFSVPESGCGCQWYADAPTGEKCQLKMNATQTFYEGTPDAFKCSNVYSLGNCTKGVQNVTWSSHSQVISGFSSGIPPECLDAMQCNGGESTRFCGEPIIKLSGFSLFSLFIALAIIGLYYSFSDKFKYKRSYKIK